MKYPFLLIVLLLCFQSIDTIAGNKVIVTGVVENSNILKKNYVDIAINRFCFNQKNIKSRIDKSGHFRFEFNISHPTDIWVDYRMNFLVAIHPGDSINIVFDGSQKHRPGLLKTIQISGTSQKLNQDIAYLQQLYYDSELYTFVDKGKRKKEVKITKTYSPTEYTEYLREQKSKLYNHFLQERNPSDEACMWAELFLQSSVLKKISRYPTLHQESNKLDSFNPGLEYYDIYLEALPIKDSMLICGYALMSYINNYHYGYARRHSFNDVKGKTIPFSSNNATTKEIYDSVIVNGIIKYTPDSLFRQMVLCEYLLQGLDRAEIDIYEKHTDLINEYIKESYLLKPLSWQYKKTKKSVQTPKLISDQILQKASNSSISNIIDSIRSNHQDNVIYIDCWATWCGPCLSEFPNSKELMNRMKNKDVVFVFICLDSKKEQWRAQIDKHQLKGEHYFLNATQSDDFRSTFEITGIPHYIMINKSGDILNTKYNLRPREASREITKLLKE